MQAEALNLLPFCGEDDFRPYLRKPFNKDGYTWATNGHLMVRVPLRNLDEADKTTDFLPNVSGVFGKHFRDSNLSRLNPASLPKETRVLESCGREHKCPSCSCKCENCDGKGNLTVSSDVDTSLSIGDAIFALRYVRLICSLPNCRIDQSPPKTEAMSFAFDGGQGLLMPMREQYGKHLDVAVCQ